MKEIKSINIIYAVLGIILVVPGIMPLAQTNTCPPEGCSITVNVDGNMGQVNRGVLGTSISGCYRSGKRPSNYYIDGAGVWNINTDPVTPYPHSDPQMLTYAKDVGISFLRFPGGSVHEYDWKKTVGPVNLRPVIRNGNRVTYGIPEFLQNSDDIGSIPVIVLSDILGTAADAANLVRYLNSPCDSTTQCTTAVPEDTVCTFQSERLNAYISNSGPDVNSAPNWPQLRVCDKHALGRSDLDQPWNVIWFEYGNETNSLWPADRYISNYLDYRDEMRNVDNQIKLGAVFASFDYSYRPHLEWNYKVILGTGHVADFFIQHNYVLHPLYHKDCCNNYSDCPGTLPLCTAIRAPDPETLFTITLAATSYQMQDEYRTLNSLVRNLTGRSNIPLAITEFNAGFAQTYPVPYRHTLGTALINADHIRQLMHADNIGMANYWLFSNATWGMVVGPDSYKPARPYGVRPNFHTFQFYNNHFGDILLNAVVESYAYETNGGGLGADPATGVHQDEILGNDLLNGQQWTITPVDGAVVSEDTGILTINFDGTENADYFHSKKTASLEPSAWYRLSGLIKPTDLRSTEPDKTLTNGVYIAVQSGVNLITNGSFEDGFANWTRAKQPSGASSSIDENVSHFGNNSARIDFNGSRDVNYWQTYQDDGTENRKSGIPVKPGTTYLLEGYIKTDNGPLDPNDEGLKTDGQGVKLVVTERLNQDLDNNGQLDRGNVWSTSHLKGKNDWTHVSKEFVTSNKAAFVKVTLDRIACNVKKNKCPVRGTAWFDDIKLTNKTSTWRITENHGSWSKVTADFVTRSIPGDPFAPVDGKVFAGRISGGETNVPGKAEFKDVKLQRLTAENYGAVPYLSVNTSKSNNGRRVYLMVINKHMTDDITAVINLNGFTPLTAQSWVLNGPSIDAHNEDGKNVRVINNIIGMISNGFNQTFEAHSLTALEISRCEDKDGDGYAVEGGDCGPEDCDDNNGAIGLYNYYQDTDADDYGDPAQSLKTCLTTPPSGYVTYNTDCVDSDSSINPDMTEVPYNGKDDDCNSATRDDDLDNDGYLIAADCNDNNGLEHPGQIWYKDYDDDNYSDGTTDSTSCIRPSGHKTTFELIALSGDCNDTDPDIKPGVSEQSCI